MKTKKSYFIAVLLGLVLFCSSTAIGAEDVLKIGVLYPLSGRMGFLGQECLRGTKILTAMVNEQGGIFGKKVELVTGDATDTKAAMSECERLITVEGVKLITGTYSSTLAIPAHQVAAKYHVTYWEGIAAEDSITTRGYKYLLRFAPKGSKMGEGAAKFMYDIVAPALGKKPGDFRYAVVRINDKWGTAIGGSSASKAKELGFNVVADIPYSATIEFSDLVMKIKSVNPDFLHFVMYPHDAFIFLKQMRDLRVNVSAMSDAGPVTMMPQIKEVLGEDANYIFDSSWAEGARRDFLDPEVVKDEEIFIKKFREAFNSEPSNAAFKAFVPTWVLFKHVLPKAGSLDPEAVRKAAGELDIPDSGTGFGYGVKFNPPDHPDAGHNVRAHVTVRQRFGDKLYYVYPTEGAVMEPILPMPKWGKRKVEEGQLKFK